MSCPSARLRPWLRPRPWFVLTATFALAACGGGRQEAQTQVAAKVNAGEISVHQVQYVLQRQGLSAHESPEVAARKALDNLIEQELAAQAARADGMEQDPAVVQALQIAQREVLAKAYQDRLATKAAAPSSDDIDRFFEAQPALFRERRLYVLQETAVEATPAQVEEIRDLARRAGGLNEVTQHLRSRSYRFDTRQFVQAAEDLPFGLLGPLAQLAPGQSIAVAQPGGTRIFTVLQVQAAPVDRRRAKEAIATYLGNQRQRELVVQGMQSLRQVARIEYLGGFATPAASAPAAAPSPKP